MTTYSEISKELVRSGEKEFYRFQGHNSYDYYNLKTCSFDSPSDHYVYFSNTVNHHYYFTLKRIRQLLNDILKGTPYTASGVALQSLETYQAVKNQVCNSDKISDLNSISLICDQNLSKLLAENSTKNQDKTQSKVIERVDRRVYGGGYGVTDAWLDLFKDLMYFSSHTRFTTRDLIELLKEIRNGYKNSKPNIVAKILVGKKRTCQISESLFDDFHKYAIMNDLERILDEGLYSPTSQLATNPKETTKEILTSYQEKREQVLRLVDKSYRRY